MPMMNSSLSTPLPSLSSERICSRFGGFVMSCARASCEARISLSLSMMPRSAASHETEITMWKHAKSRASEVERYTSPKPTVVAVTKQW